MTENRGERRAETAKLNDDSDMIEVSIEESLTGQHEQGRKGGNLQTDLGTQAELKRVADPEAHQSVKKGDHMAHGQHTDEPHPAEQVVSEDR